MVSARNRMMQASKAWQSVAPQDNDANNPLDDAQLQMLVEALAAQRTYLDAKAAAQEALVIRLP